MQTAEWGCEVMQCKDIPDIPVLKFLRDMPDIQGFPGVKAPANWCSGGERDVRNAMPTLPSEKLALAKMRQLINRGLVDGCPCGCRGDFTLTEKGADFLRKHGEAAA